MGRKGLVLSLGLLAGCSFVDDFDKFKTALPADDAGVVPSLRRIEPFCWGSGDFRVQLLPGRMGRAKRSADADQPESGSVQPAGHNLWRRRQKHVRAACDQANIHDQSRFSAADRLHGHFGGLSQPELKMLCEDAEG